MSFYSSCYYKETFHLGLQWVLALCAFWDSVKVAYREIEAWQYRTGMLTRTLKLDLTKNHNLLVHKIKAS